MLVNHKPINNIFIQNKPVKSILAVEFVRYYMFILEKLVAIVHQPQEGCANVLQVAADMVYGTVSTANYCILVN